MASNAMRCVTITSTGQQQIATAYSSSETTHARSSNTTSIHRLMINETMINAQIMRDNDNDGQVEVEVFGANVRVPPPYSTLPEYYQPLLYLTVVKYVPGVQSLNHDDASSRPRNVCFRSFEDSHGNGNCSTTSPLTEKKKKEITITTTAKKITKTIGTRNNEMRQGHPSINNSA